MDAITKLNIKLYADGADKAGMLEMHHHPHISGFTTNPTLMRKAGITNYEMFAKDILSHITDRPISFEVFSDDFLEMEQQAYRIASWGPNVYVKIPVMNTKGKSATPLIKRLAHHGVQLNVTAIFTMDQVEAVCDALGGGSPSVVSVFAGRIADSGRDPVPLMRAARAVVDRCPLAELLWASTREVLNLVQAQESGCHIITATNDILKKLDSIGKDLHEFSLDTVKMFYNDALKAGFTLPVERISRAA